MIKAGSNLLEIAVEGTSITYPGVRFEISSDGRRVTGRILLGQANPMGRSFCRVNYTRPTYWTDDQHAAALRVAGHWLRDIGGIGLLTKRQLCHIVPRLKDGHAEQPMHWAIDAYARSEWHRKNKLWRSIGDFFKSDACDMWLERSEHYQNHVKQLERQRLDRQHVERQRQGTTLVTQLSEVHLQYHWRLAEKDMHRRIRLEARFGQRAYQRLTALQQSVLRKQCEIERAGTWPDDAGPMAMENDRFCAFVYSRSLHQHALRLRTSAESLMGFCPKTPYTLNELTGEVERRSDLTGEPGNPLLTMSEAELRSLLPSDTPADREATPPIAGSLPANDARAHAEGTQE